ncbi:MAG: class I SAM-dependent methyltransferase [Methanomicrobiales archaeon]|nr:class I SAM-dependent methyltransferase [Methanomicrobiales archaeon]
MRFPADDSERRKWQNPEAILASIGLKKGDVFVDVGCGEGFFALPAAHIVGTKGRVYGIDVNPDAIERLTNAARQEGLAHLNAMVGVGETTVACEECADVIFYGICLHDFRDPEAVLACARRMIKDSGILIDLDWKPVPSPFGPPLRIRFSLEKAERLITAGGFSIRSTRDVGPWHYCITAEPVPR